MTQVGTTTEKFDVKGGHLVEKVAALAADYSIEVERDRLDGRRGGNDGAL